MRHGSALTILVDMDDVMEDFLPAWIDILNEKYGRDVFLGDVSDWHIDQFYPGLTHKQIYGVLDDYDLWAKVFPKTGAREYMKRLIEDGHEVFVVTASRPETMYRKYDMVLREYFPFIDPVYIINAHVKQMIRGDVLIDDGPHNLGGGEYAKILMDAPHNKCFDESEIGAIRAHSWSEIYTIIQQLSREKAERYGTTHEHHQA